VCCWQREKEVGYTVQSGYRALREDHHGQHRECFKYLWDLKVPGTTKIFGWKALLDRLPSKANLEMRGMGMGSNHYPLCAKEVETIQHLLITCEAAQQLWVKCDKWLGISSTRSNEVYSHFCGFSLSFLSVKANKAWKGMWLVLVKEIWNHRNRLIFNKEKVDEVEIFALVQMNAWTWAMFSGIRVQGSLSEWFMNTFEFLKQM